MVKDEEFKFILGNYWFGKKEDSEIYDQNVSINGATEDRTSRITTTVSIPWSSTPTAPTTSSAARTPRPCAYS